MNERLILDRNPAVWSKGCARFAALADELRRLGAAGELHHVGSTALPGALTKGDVDAQLRVHADDFPSARMTLGERLSESFVDNPGGFRLPHGCSFDDKSAQPTVGLHLTVADSSADIQWVFGVMLRESEALAEGYDAIKRAFDGHSMSAYREAKDGFFARLVTTPRFAEVRRTRPIGRMDDLVIVS